MRSPSEDQFFALARSSPWRWSTLRFTVTWHGRMRSPAPGWEREPVRAWVARPDGLRVESLDGRLLVAERQPESPLSIRVLVSVDARADHSAVERPADVPLAGEPEFYESGLVRYLGDRFLGGDPMYENYHWVAMLDPHELADGVLDRPGVPPLDVEGTSEVDHHERSALEAVVRPTDTYDPRCSCCALLFGARSEAILAASGGGPTAAERNASLRYPDAYRVRLDMQTSVCVLSEEIGGSAPGSGHEVVIESVDDDLPDELFKSSPHNRWLLRGRG